MSVEKYFSATNVPYKPDKKIGGLAPTWYKPLPKGTFKKRIN